MSIKKKQALPLDEIFTPQGTLNDVLQNPSMDFLMNVFNIPRVYGVSGFGQWDVGKHTMATAFLCLYWAKHRGYTSTDRNALVTSALLHDIHEAVTGDILPHFKTPEVKESIQSIQDRIEAYFNIEHESQLDIDLKLVDLISFLYEIAQSSPKGLDVSKRSLIYRMFMKQKTIVYRYAAEKGIEQESVYDFMYTLGLESKKKSR